MRKLLLYGLICSLLSCQSKLTEIPVTDINLKDAIESGREDSFDSYCKSIDYVKLETNDSVLLRNPFYVFTDSTIIAYERHVIHQFNYDGKHLNSYLKHGQGPGDILHLNRMYWNQDLKCIHAFDGGKRKIMTFDENLNLLDEQSFSIPIHAMVINRNLLFCGMSKDNFRYKEADCLVAKYDLNTKNSEILFRSTKEQFKAETFPIFAFGTDIFQSDTVFYFKEHRSDSIFCFTADNLKPQFAYRIHAGEPYPEELDYRHENRHEILDYINVESCKDLGDKLLLNYTYKSHNTKKAIFYKNTGEVVCMKDNRWNSIDNGMAIKLYSKVKDNIWFAGDIKPEQLFNSELNKRLNRNPYGSFKLLNILSNTDMEDNPILMFVKLK